MLLDGRVAIITGGSRGIGAATAKTLAKEGAAVVVNYLQRQDKAQAVVDDIVGLGGRAIAVRADVTQREAVDGMVGECLETFGQVDILVNNAAFPNVRKKFADITWEDYQWQIDGSLKASFNCCQAALPSMIARRTGKIINILTTGVQSPMPGSHAYLTGKSALLGFTRTLALEMGPHNVAVNMVMPGFALTDRATGMSEEFKRQFAAETPMQRIAEAEDVAGAILFLSSDWSRFVTGAIVPVTGGYLMP